MTENNKAMPSEGERKHVTVVFTDLSGYTSMSEKLDPEDVKAIMNKIFGAIDRIAEKHGGKVNQHIGDEAMIVFGVPKSREDDPVRAIMAVQEIHETIPGLYPASQEMLGEPLRMHSGVSTGLVVTGAIDLAGPYGLLGDTVNVAARLAKLAAQGEILVSCETRRISEQHIDFIEMDPVELKGKSEPTVVSKVIGMKARPSTQKNAVGNRSNLVGRGVEIAELELSYQKLLKGEGSVVRITGEAGSGKSRLVEEFKGRLDLDKVLWREGFSYSYSTNVPYYPLKDLISRAWDIEESDSQDVVRNKISQNIFRLTGNGSNHAPYIGRLFGVNYSEMDDVSPEYWRSGLQDAVKVLLTSLSQHGPTILQFEDLHWADPSSLELMRSIIGDRSHPVMFILTSRPPFTLGDPEWSDKTAEHHRDIRLSELNADEIQEMIESLLNSNKVNRSLAKLIKEKTEGNPFYVEEVVNSLIESDKLVCRNNEWQLAISLDEVSIPSTIAGIVGARLDNLPEVSKKVAQEAAVIGRVFFQTILTRISQNQEGIDLALKDLSEFDLIRIRDLEPELEFIFKHALTQEVAYNGILREKREKIHEKIGEVMETLFPDRVSDFYETLAFHFQKSHRTDKAVQYLILSGIKSLNQYGLEESHKYFSEAFSMLMEKHEMTAEDNETIVELLSQWGKVFYYRGHFRELQELLEVHIDRLESVGNRSGLGMCRTWLGLALWHRERPKLAYGQFHRAIELAREDGDDQAVGIASAWLACACTDLGEFEEGIGHVTLALDIAKRDETDHFASFSALGADGYLNCGRGDRIKIKAAGDALLEHGQKFSTLRSTIFGYWIIGLSHLVGGDFGAASQWFKRCSDESSDPWLGLFPKVCLGLSRLYEGKYDEAEQPLRDVVNFSDKVGAETVGVPSYGLLGIVLVSKGHLSKGMKMWEETAEWWLEHGGKWRVAEIGFIFATLYLDIKLRSTPVKITDLLKNPGFVFKHALPAARKAESHFLGTMSIADEIGSVALSGMCRENLGRLYKARGQKAKAIAMFDDSIAYYELANCPIFIQQATQARDELS